MVDVGEGKWAVEEFRYVKDLSALVNNLGYDGFGHLDVENNKNV